jgi:hypothetical protein
MLGLIYGSFLNAWVSCEIPKPINWNIPFTTCPLQAGDDGLFTQTSLLGGNEFENGQEDAFDNLTKLWDRG